MEYKIGDVVTIQAVVTKLGTWDNRPTAFLQFENSGGCSVFQQDLKLVSSAEEEAE